MALIFSDAFSLDHRTRHQGKASIPYPKANAIPAISAVVHNQGLFQALIACLSTSPADMEAPELSRGQVTVAGSRKRTSSMDGVVGDVHPPSKSMKLSHVPHVVKRSTAHDGRPQMNVKLLAATILFVAFEHLDHWPAAFVRVYSEDCFGLRAWVDEALCRLFVENLALAHAIDKSSNGDASMIDVEGNADALVVSEFYEIFNYTTDVLSVNGSSVSPPKKRGSLSSNGSGSSIATRRFQRQRSASSDSIDMTDRASTPPTIFGSMTVDYGEESDSGEEEEVVALTTSAPRSDSNDNGGSSSSGEDGQEVDTSAKSYNEDDNGRESTSPASPITEEPPKLKLTYPVEQHVLNFAQVRQRYFGANLASAQRAIAESLQRRLDIKSKQNSGLLQTLPLFAGVPEVRRLITANLEKWLQSPALAGLARHLFAHTVSLFRNADPPLPADLDAIDNILSMKLKANQLNAHVENITSIAKRIPTSAVANHIYDRLLRQILISLVSIDSSASDQLKMIHGVHGVFPHSLSASGIAAAVMGLIHKKPGVCDEWSHEIFVGRICKILRDVAHDLGPAYNGLELLRAIAEYRYPDDGERLQQCESDRARVLFQCVLLCVDSPEDLQKFLGNEITAKKGSAEILSSFRVTLSTARKVVLKWFCEEYARFCTSSDDGDNTQNGIIGAGIPDYSSILDGVTKKAMSGWETTLRALSFLEPPESPRLQHFLSSSTACDTSSADDIFIRTRLCFEFGGDVDDEMIRIVINAAVHGEKRIPPVIALGVLEHLFHGCKKDRQAVMTLEDPTLLWEFYHLVEYSPCVELHQETGDSIVLPMDDAHLSVNGGNNTNDSIKSRDLPRLAYPGLWWRATCLALIMCGASPSTIGRSAWNEHPTLKTLIKMVTSDRYLFPTVDCDGKEREEMKNTEQAMRDEEAKVTEFLFLPRRASKPLAKESQDTKSSLGGSRVSRRQQEKREEQVKKQQEKEAQESQKEANRRRKMLRVAQKSIMLLDPRKGPRKPPKESADLIFSVGEHFDLQRRFQRATEPDFLLNTIGNTSRGAIERAYDWLIPIVSVVPETIVRLPASASCFLLLRAYGTEGEERAQLQELSTPLLAHVRESLRGSFGEADAIRASDLLLGDLASHTADRRRCARKVLNDAIGEEIVGDLREPFAKSNCGWMLNLLNLKHTTSILPGAIRRLSQAASFERGRVLRFLVLALDNLSEVATEKNLMEGYRFSSTLIDLISSRPTIFASTMVLFPDLRSLATRLVNSEFELHLSDSFRNDITTFGASSEVKKQCHIVLCCGPTGQSASQPINVVLPAALIESSCVLLSIWSKEDDGNAIDGLVRMLMRGDERVSDGDIESEQTGKGLASATLSSTGQPAIPVESVSFAVGYKAFTTYLELNKCVSLLYQWVMLARSRSDFIAKRAALTAPTSFIPRLLLCSGLPQASLLSMIDRLGKLGDKNDNLDKIYNKLLIPSAASEWDIGRLGKKKEVSRKLLGRLSAYSRMYKLSELKGEDRISTTFLRWLSRSNQETEKPRRQKAKESKPCAARLGKLIYNAKILDTVAAEPMDERDRSENELTQGETSEMTEFLMCQDCSERYMFSGTKLEDVAAFFSEAIGDEQVRALDVWLQQNLDRSLLVGVDAAFVPSFMGLDIACLLLKMFRDLERKSESLGAALVKWVPILAIDAGSPELWTFLLTKGQKPQFLWSNLMSRCTLLWSRDHTVACRDWILAQDDFTSLDLGKLVRFLVQSMSCSNIHSERFVDISSAKKGSGGVGFTEQSVRQCIDVSIMGLISGSEDEENLIQSTSRNHPPEALVLLLLLSRLGRKHAQLVSQTLVERLDRDIDDKVRGSLLASVLRVYTCFPQYMNLGLAMLRSALKEAVEKFPLDWLSWRSPMDDSFENLMMLLVQSGVPGLVVPALVDDAKKHPLLILRKLGRMEELLEQDATAHSSFLVDSEKRGIISGRSLADPVMAKVDATTSLKVTVRHWGYNYTESLWISFLDIVTSGTDQTVIPIFRFSPSVCHPISHFCCCHYHTAPLSSCSSLLFGGLQSTMRYCLDVAFEWASATFWVRIFDSYRCKPNYAPVTVWYDSRQNCPRCSLPFRPRTNLAGMNGCPITWSTASHRWGPSAMFC